MKPSVLFSFLLILISCGCSETTREFISRDDLRSSDDIKVLSVMLKDGSIVAFNDEGGKYVEHFNESRFYRAIVGITWTGKSVELKPDSVVQVQIERYEENVGGTVLLVILGAAAAVGAYFLLLVLAWAGH